MDVKPSRRKSGRTRVLGRVKRGRGGQLQPHAAGGTFDPLRLAFACRWAGAENIQTAWSAAARVFASRKSAVASEQRCAHWPG